MISLGTPTVKEFCKHILPFGPLQEIYQRNSADLVRPPGKAMLFEWKV